MENNTCIPIWNANTLQFVILTNDTWSKIIQISWYLVPGSYSEHKNYLTSRKLTGSTKRNTFIYVRVSSMVNTAGNYFL